MGRAPCCDKVNVKKGPWAPEEDGKLKDYIEKYGTGGNWIALPQKIGINRCGKSCRLRWLNYLRPNIKHGGFSEEEDNIICSLYISIGSRWSIIAAQLPGRTDNDIKNYWNTRLKKKLLRRRKQSQPRVLVSSEDLKDANGMERLSNSAIERLQLHIQLQNLQNTNISNSVNLTSWPFKLNPIQEKIISSLQLLNESSNPLMMQHLPPNALQNSEFISPVSNNNLQQEYPLFSNKLINITDNFTSECNTSGSLPHLPEGPEPDHNMELEKFWEFHAEIEKFLTSNVANPNLPLDHVRAKEFEDFIEMDGASNNMGWWSNDFDCNIPQLLDHQV